MWAIDHRTKRIVELPQFPSRLVRAALQRGFQDFVLYHNAMAKDAMRVMEWGLAGKSLLQVSLHQKEDS